MNLEELDKNRHASLSIIELADELIKKLEANDRVILERKISIESTDRLTNEITTVLRHALTETQIGDDAAAKIIKISEIISSLVSSLEASMRVSSEDLIRLEATQDGMRRALEAVKSTGQIRIQELEKMEREEDQQESLKVINVDNHRKPPTSRSVASRSKGR